MDQCRQTRNVDTSTRRDNPRHRHPTCLCGRRHTPTKHALAHALHSARALLQRINPPCRVARGSASRSHTRCCSSQVCLDLACVVECSGRVSCGAYVGAHTRSAPVKWTWTFPCVSWRCTSTSNGGVPDARDDGRLSVTLVHGPARPIPQSSRRAITLRACRQRAKF